MLPLLTNGGWFPPLINITDIPCSFIIDLDVYSKVYRTDFNPLDFNCNNTRNLNESLVSTPIPLLVTPRSMAEVTLSTTGDTIHSTPRTGNAIITLIPIRVCNDLFFMKFT